MAGDPVNSNVLWSGGVNASYYMDASKTTDGGTTWTRYTLGTAYGSLYSITVDPTNSSIVYASGYENNQSAVFKTTNAGGNWNKLTATGLSGYVYALEVDPVTPNIIYAGTTSGVYKSTDGGNAWTSTGFPGGSTQALLLYNTGRSVVIYAGTNGNGVYTSSNGGSTWSQMNAGLNDDLYINCLAVNPADHYLFAGTACGGVYRESTIIGLEEASNELQRVITLRAFPDPVRTKARIRFTLGKPTMVNVSIFDIQGRSVKTLVSGVRDAGLHDVQWNCLDDGNQAVSAGVYFYKMQTDFGTIVGKLIVLR